MNKVDEHNEADSLLIELKALQPFVFHNVIFFRDQTLWDTQVLKKRQSGRDCHLTLYTCVHL